MRRPFLILLLLVFLAGCDTNEAAPEEALLLYITNQDGASVSIFNTAREQVETTVDLTASGFSATSKPHFAVVEPDGSAWYVSLIGENRVAKFTAANTLAGSVEMAVPGMMALEPGGDYLFAGRSMSAVNPPASVAFIDRNAMTLDEERPVVFPRPHALGAAGTTVYTASLGENRIAVVPVDGSATTFTTTGGAASSLSHMGISPDGSLLVVTGEPGGVLYFMKRSADGLLTPDGALALGGKPWHPHFSPDGSRIAVPLKDANAVAFIDVAGRTELFRVTGAGLAEPHGSAFSHDGKTLYVTNNNTKGTYATATPGAGTLVVIDVGARVIRKAVEVGKNPTGIGHATHAGNAHAGH